jgi:hypothetical protein
MRHERTSAQREPVTRPDQVWALDYQTDVTADGRQVRFLNVVDEFTREAFATRAARSWSADDTVALLDELIATLGRRPQHVRMDDCPELRRTRCGTGPVHRHRHGLHRFGIDGHCTLIADGPQTGVQSHRWSMMVAGGPENTRAYVEYEAATRRHRALWPTDTLTDD